MRRLLGSLAGLGMLVLAACSHASASTEDRDAGSSFESGQAVDDYVATEADFGCIDAWTQVRRMRITNPRSDDAKSEAIAIAVKNESGGEYPVGTIVQVIPTHAMAKRRAGFNTRGNDWEFFVLDVSDAGTKIVQRGGAEVTAPRIGSCQQCHARAKSFDFLCEDNHGCNSNGLTTTELMEMQADDPRCTAHE